MKKRILSIAVAVFSLGVACVVSARVKPAEKPRILISTDIGGTDPDDNQSMAHFLMYSDEFDTEGLVSSRHTARAARRRYSA